MVPVMLQYINYSSGQGRGTCDNHFASLSLCRRLAIAESALGEHLYT